MWESACGGVKEKYYYSTQFSPPPPSMTVISLSFMLAMQRLCIEGSSGEMTWDALGDRMISTLVDEVRNSIAT